MEKETEEKKKMAELLTHIKNTLFSSGGMEKTEAAQS